jgi:hypothetical protein
MQELSRTQEEASPAEIAPAAAASLSEFRRLSADLAGASAEARIEAAHKLRLLGAVAMDPLIPALKDKEVKVRVAAAESLGHVGDEKAIQPLTEALRALYPGKSPKRWRLMGAFLAVCTVVFSIAGIVAALVTGGLGALLGGAAEMLGSFDGLDAKTDNASRAYAEALFRIADRSPTPELRYALPHLREIADDGVLQDKHTRGASRAAARRIQKLTLELDKLPVASAAPRMDEKTLPVAAAAPHSDGETLPRPSAGQ